MPKRRDLEVQPTYLLDEDTGGPEICAILRKAGLVVEDTRNHFKPKDGRRSVLDTEWIPEVARRGWWAVTRDGAILGTKREHEAHILANGVLLVIRGHHLTMVAMANALISAHNRLKVFIPKRERPMVIYVFPDGRIQLHEGGERRGGKKRD